MPVYVWNKEESEQEVYFSPDRHRGRVAGSIDAGAILFDSKDLLSGKLERLISLRVLGVQAWQEILKVRIPESRRTRRTARPGANYQRHD